MPKKKKLCLMAPVVLGFFAFACFGTRTEKGTSQSSPPANVEAAIGAPPPSADDVQLLRARMAGLEAELHTMNPVAAVAPAAPAIDAATRIADQTPELARRLPDAATLQAHYDAAFAAETADARWAPAEESSLVAFFGTDAAKGARLEKAECRASMCRLRMNFDDHDARSHFLAQIGSAPFDHGGFYRADDANKAFTLYTAREGQTLPGLDPGPT